MNESDPFTVTGNLHDSDIPSAEEATSLPETISRYRIQRVLGRGGFGLVYLALDERLDRRVAVKVPHRHLVEKAESAESYVLEAKTVAGLDHPSIVPVFDVGSTEEFPCFVVSKYIDGSDLAAKVRRGRINSMRAAELIATVAEALHYAHKQGLVHRDIKPGNILINQEGAPFLVDFGLALKESETGKGPRYAGTTAYMSPEQARGEGHRVDGRSDIFSLGVVFYELLVGKRPFRADTEIELLDQVTSFDPRPPRQLSDEIPRELERICLKAISKRSSERYTTARDLSEDLRLFLSQQAPTDSSHGDSVVSASATEVSGASNSATSNASNSQLGMASTSVVMPSWDSQPLRIVPKGLRSFDQHDAEFFLELLPGARDRDGLPDSVRFWKTHIEETDPAATFPVGLLYGPSGCGKSSMVKAGLLPHLGANVLTVYVEATSTDTEARLLKGIRRYCPELPADLSLRSAILALRQGRGLSKDEKVLLVLDQFEQWLHANRDSENTPLLNALRQCDGGHAQAILMVRDDFWMAATRTMRQLEVPIVEGHNAGAVDLFGTRHAIKVLTAFGRAYDDLPAAGKITRKQQEFLDQAVSGLSEDGKVVCVRLALFAEMMRGKSWTPTTLKEVGGTAGVGVSFLEESFSSTSASPQHRYHQQAARAVLKGLLPDSGTDIKGHMRSYDDLFELSDYVSNQDFDDLLRVLDVELRLITPTDPGGDHTDAPTVDSRRQYYQLAHDYLVPSLRDWLTRKQKETIRGRAQLVLAEHAALWNAKPDPRRLPAWMQWATISLVTSRSHWSEAERSMMRSATKHYTSRFAVAIMLIALLGWGAWEARGRSAARAAVDQLATAGTSQVATVIDDLAPYRRWARSLLVETIQQSGEASRERLHASLALLPDDATQADFLRDRLLLVDPKTHAVIREALSNTSHDVTSAKSLWRILDDSTGDTRIRFNAALALASFDPPGDAQDERWKPHAEFIANALLDSIVARAGDYQALVDGLQGASSVLFDPLHTVFQDVAPDQSRRMLATNVLIDYFSNDAAAVAQLVQDADPVQFTQLFPIAQQHQEAVVRSLDECVQLSSESNAAEEDLERLARRQANAAAVLLRFGKADHVWPMLEHSPDPRARSYLIHQIRPLGVPAELLLERLPVELEVSARRALLLAIGELEKDTVNDRQRTSTVQTVQRLFLEDSDAGVHSAAEWLLRKWGQTEWLAKAELQLSSNATIGDRMWYYTPHQFTMVVIDGTDNPNVGRRFEMATKEVTRRQIEQFDPQQRFNPEAHPTLDCPAGVVTWHQAVRYCQWLNEQEGIPESEWCYPPLEQIQGIKPMRADLTKTGYRLPTQAEFEHAILAGATTTWFFGQNVELLPNYAWFYVNSNHRTWPPGMLKPNDFGLFDVHGNLAEWRADLSPWNDQRVMIGGGTYGTFDGGTMVATQAGTTVPNPHFNSYGFRIARTRRGPPP